MFLVLIETSGNQNYIFSTNKLRENVGASELTFQAGTTWILEAVAQNGGNPLLGLWKKTLQGQDLIQENELRQKLINSELNPAIETPKCKKAEIIVAASGKALIVAEDEKTARAIIQTVTQRALIEAPGLDLFGVFHEFQWERDALSEICEIVHRKFLEARSRQSSPDLRFLRLPVVAECATSGLPAAVVDLRAPGEKGVLRSTVADRKRKYYDNNIRRIQSLLNRHKIDKNFAHSIKVLDQELNDESEMPDRLSQWRAVIHADGNGLGEIFLKFGQHLNTIGKMTGNPQQDNRIYIDCLRRFSLALDVCTERAFVSALQSLKPENQKLPIVPIVLGGDDLTIVCDGQLALPFTEKFLKAFEEETAKQDEAHYNGIITEIAQAALGVGRISSCAGIAIIKPHFPFSVAYELSEALMQSAKDVKRKLTHEVHSNSIPYPCSALDFHVLYDSSGVELSHIRQRLEPEASTYLYIAPYVVTPLQQLNVSPIMQTWADQHHWERLKHRIRALLATDENDGRRKLPNSQMHDLRSALLLGASLADARFRLIRSRYIDALPENNDRIPIDIRALEGDPESLFTWIEDPQTGDKSRRTGFLDALDAADFLVTSNSSQNEDN